ncbi:hypothetical protein EVAR_45265_1 [Eumeta japonica]|uniref:Uncharacterized protein n=1 Tax=Eumeta variegata TaxID=151549 RepID=A0A4C1XBM5_EUMVA|nr:hypothetical protein EVAR_45265_1 [Eumeta japonica]
MYFVPEALFTLEHRVREGAAFIVACVQPLHCLDSNRSPVSLRTAALAGRCWKQQQVYDLWTRIVRNEPTICDICMSTMTLASPVSSSRPDCTIKLQVIQNIFYLNSHECMVVRTLDTLRDPELSTISKYTRDVSEHLFTAVECHPNARLSSAVSLQKAAQLFHDL